jgi:hypothetical protein
VDRREDFAQTIRLPGRPRAVWDEKIAEQIIRMRGFGHEVKEITACLDISEYQLYSLYRLEMEEGKTIFLTQVGNKGYQAAMNGNVDMIKFILERRSPHFKPPAKSETASVDSQQLLTEIKVTLVHTSQPIEDAPKAERLKADQEVDEKPW